MRITQKDTGCYFLGLFLADAGFAGDFLALAAGLRRARGETPIRVSRASDSFTACVRRRARAAVLTAAAGCGACLLRCAALEGTRT